MNSASLSIQRVYLLVWGFFFFKKMQYPEILCFDLFRGPKSLIQINLRLNMVLCLRLQVSLQCVSIHNIGMCYGFVITRIY